MFGLDGARENHGWLGARAEQLVDPDFDALYFALTGAGTAAATPFQTEAGAALTLEDGVSALIVEDVLVNPELVANRALVVGGATIDSAVAFAYGSSLKCSGAQYLGVALPTIGAEDFGFRFRYRPDAHSGVRDVARFANDQLIVQLDATTNWQVFDGVWHQREVAAAAPLLAEDGGGLTLEDASTLTTEASGGNLAPFLSEAGLTLTDEAGAALLPEGVPGDPVSVGVWYDLALEREGPLMVLKVDGAVVLSWTTTLALAATEARVGTANASPGADGHYQDIRFYLKGSTAAGRRDGRPMTSRFRRSVCGVGRL